MSKLTLPVTVKDTLDDLCDTLGVAIAADSEVQKPIATRDLDEKMFRFARAICQAFPEVEVELAERADADCQLTAEDTPWHQAAVPR